MPDPITLTPLRRIATPNGDVMHGLRRDEPGFAGFGEAYLSWVNRGAVKGWKRHLAMTLNLVCAGGRVRLVVRDGGQPEAIREVVLGPDEPATRQRLTVPPGWWVAFQGLEPGPNLLLNLADLPHNPAEAQTRPLDAFEADWSLP